MRRHIVQAMEKQQKTFDVRNGHQTHSVQHGHCVDGNMVLDPPTYQQTESKHEPQQYPSYLEQPQQPYSQPQQLYPPQPQQLYPPHPPVQHGYRISGTIVFYNNIPTDINVNHFKDLGDGYALNRDGSFFCGVWFREDSIHKVRSLGCGYTKDAFYVYYNGIKFDATTMNFKVLSHGYTKTSFDVFYRGSKINGAHESSFVADNVNPGYTSDKNSRYYQGNRT